MSRTAGANIRLERLAALLPAIRLWALYALALLALSAPAGAASLKALHRFVDTGNGTASHYALGASPQSELVQASDGNFYGTTESGGTSLCPTGSGGTTGCGTVFRMTP